MKPSSCPNNRDHLKDAQDLTAGLYETISAYGDRAGQTMEILRTSSMAAAAGAATTSEALSLTSAMTKAYGDTSAAAVRKAADLAIMTVRLGETNFPELAASIGRTTPLAAALGVTQEELAASFASLTGAQGSTAEVSTRLKSLFAKMLAPTKEMQAATTALGVADAATLVQTHGLTGALRLMVSQTDGSDAAIRRLVGSDEALIAVLEMLGPGAATMAQNVEAMGGAAGATETAYGEMTTGVDAAGHAWNQMRAQLMATLGDLGDALLPVLTDAGERLRPLINYITRVVQAFAGAPTSIRVVTIAAAAGGGGGAVGVAGPGDGGRPIPGGAARGRGDAGARRGGGAGSGSSDVRSRGNVFGRPTHSGRPRCGNPPAGKRRRGRRRRPAGCGWRRGRLGADGRRIDRRARSRGNAPAGGRR